ncbi:hypothetical protein H8959_003363 [Pygathrix nigripes]
MGLPWGRLPEPPPSGERLVETYRGQVFPSTPHLPPRAGACGANTPTTLAPLSALEGVLYKAGRDRPTSQMGLGAVTKVRGHLPRALPLPTSTPGFEVRFGHMHLKSRSGHHRHPIRQPPGLHNPSERPPWITALTRCFALVEPGVAKGS